MHLKGFDRWARQQEINRRGRDKVREAVREAVRECHEGNLTRFRDLVYPLGEAVVKNRFDIEPETFREWIRLTAASE